MAKHLIKANAKELTARAKADKGDFSASPDIDHTGRGILKIRNASWEINDKYAQPGDLNVQRAENGGLTDVEVQRSQYTAIQSIYHPPSQSSSLFIQPSSWSSSVNIVVPGGYIAGKTITGNDGKQYVEMINPETGKADVILGQLSCMNPNSDIFDPSKRTTQSLRDDADHFEINYKVDESGKIVKRPESEIAFREMMVDLTNRATKLPSQLDMITIITNDVLKDSARSASGFTSSAKTGIETPAAPADSFSNVVAPTAAAPVQSVVFKTGAPKAPWAVDAPKLELQL